MRKYSSYKGEISPAKRGMIMNPKNTVSFIKRFMGAEWQDADVQKMLTMVTYEVVNKNNKPYVRIEGKDYSAEEISSYILADLAKVASDYYGEDVKDCVITVPAWFNDVQRKATKLAGELAGLNVHRIINEPTAAILAAGMDKEDKERLVLVNDLGCGTEDVSICEVSQGMVEVLASDGDVFLGGQNYDNEIVNWLAEEFMKDHANVDLRKDPMAYARLVEAAEKAKCELSTSTSTEINLPYITVMDGVPQMLVTTLTRAKFEQITKKFTDKVVEIAKRAIEKAKKTPATPQTNTQPQAQSGQATDNAQNQKHVVVKKAGCWMPPWDVAAAMRIYLLTIRSFTVWNSRMGR